jgi:Mn2+/Fe2+ NRAMP family transporter
MDPAKIRMRYLLGIIVAALLTAGVLRHVLHVNAGFTRKEILALALIAATVIITIFVVFVRKRRP